MITKLAANRRENTLDTGEGQATGLSPKSLMFVAMILFLGLVIILGLTACAPTEPPIEEAIVGKWTNPHGGVIHFYADNTGFVPGDESQTPAIPSAKFTYYFQDKAHLEFRVDGQAPVVVEIKLEGDTMTWFGQADGVRFIYTRAE